jgi:ornithine cyclodeaminase
MSLATTPLLVLGAMDLEVLLPPAVCIAAVEAAMTATSRGDAVLPLRSSTSVSGTTGRLILMPCVLGSPKNAEAPGATPFVFGLKVVSKFQRPAGDPLGSHVGVVLLFDGESGRLLALLEGGTLTALRTAAASALATRILARANASVVAILGTGEEAYRHAIAMCAIRPVREMRIWGRSAAHAEALVARLRVSLGRSDESVALRIAPGVPEAVTGAHIVCTTTSAKEPILQGAWLDAGTHLNLVGSAIPTTAEVDTECVRRGRIYVDYRRSAEAEAGELRAALAAGVIDAQHIRGEIGDVILGRVPGRETDADITIYKSLGIAAQDLAAAVWALAGAAAQQRGVRVSLE